MKRPIQTALITASCVLGMVATTNAQTKKPAAKKDDAKPATAAPAKNKVLANGFTRLPSSIEYKIVKHGTGTHKPAPGDHMELFIHVHVGDSVLFDSRKMYNPTKPVPVVVQPPRSKGDLMEGFMLLVAGDSALMRVSVDTLKKAGNQMLPWMKEGEGQIMEYEVVLVTVRTDAEEKKHAEEEGNKQKAIDEKLLADYFAKNNIKATKTASGLYYAILKEGTGANIKKGQAASVNYTGKLLNGKTFDSNTDTSFKHPEPFTVPVGKGSVIKGWDEGLQLFKKGTKAMLYIPSGLAYGSQDRGQQIPANSILVFEIEIVNVEDAPEQGAAVNPEEQAKKDDKILKDYFAKNKINATRTASGLYYTMSEKGLGENAKPGKKLTMNYTGRTLDGKTFDSNTDPKFNHVSPFTFTLGVGQVIRGWDEGVQLFKLGGKGVLYIPSGLGYGPNGMGSAIPPNGILMFDVEVVGIDN